MCCEYDFLFLLNFQAYQKWKAEHKQGEPRLPGLSNFNHDQLFFLNFAQVSTPGPSTVKILNIGTCMSEQKV